jgi:hypothetical protein
MLNPEDGCLFDCVVRSATSNKMVEAKTRCVHMVERQRTLWKMGMPAVQVWHQSKGMTRLEKQ